MRAVPFFVLALLTSACLIPRNPGTGSTSSGGGYASSGGGGGGGSYGSDGSDGTAYGATPANATTGSAAPAAPQTVSVTIRSSCDHTVPVFYGEKPGFSSGTRSTVSSNSVSSQTFQVGDLMWILDDSDQPIGSTSISSSTREIEISSNCGGLSAR